MLSSLMNAVFKKSNTYFEKIYNDNLKIAEGDYNFTIFSFASGSYKKFFRFNGAETLYKINADQEANILVDSTLAIKGGKFKVVLVLPNGEVITLYEYIEKGSLGIFNFEERRTSVHKIPKGMSYIKVVGFNARGAYNIKVSPAKEGEKINIEMNSSK